MPPLTEEGEREPRRERPGPALMSVTVQQVALALRVYPPLSRVGPGGIACSAPLA